MYWQRFWQQFNGGRRSEQGQGFGYGFGPQGGGFNFNFNEGFGGPPWGRRRQRFERGDVRLAILSLLAERPMHGYELIKEMERRFGGTYSPSPGTVYPTLQMLEDMGYVTVQQQDGKKVYTITDEGRAHLNERQESTEDLWGRMSGWWNSQDAEQMRSLMREFRDLMASLRPAFHGLSAEQAAQLRNILQRTRREIDEVFHAPAGAGRREPEEPRGEPREF